MSVAGLECIDKLSTHRSVSSPEMSVDMNINGTQVLLAGAISFTVVNIALATLKVLDHYNLVVLDSNGLRWLTDAWFGYIVAAIAITLLLAFSYFRCPPDQRFRFKWSSLHWCNLWNWCLIAVRASVNLVRDNVLVSVFAAWGVVALVMLWTGTRSSIPGLQLNGVFLTVAWLYLLWSVPLIARERVILVGAVPAYIIVSAYWIPEIFKESDAPIYLILLPLAPAVIFLVVWIPAQYGFLRLRTKYSCRPRLGPFVETLTFTSLAAPWLTAAYFLPDIFLDQHNQIISALITVLIGLIWSTLISVPFARFVRSLL